MTKIKLHSRIPRINLCLLIIAVSGFLFGCETMERSVGEEAVVQEVAIRENKAQDAFFTNFESTFRKKLEATGCPGAAVVVVRDSSIIYMKGFGVKEAGKGDSVDANTVFRLGSLSKGFTGVLSGILVDEDAFSWESKVIEAIPSFRFKDSLQARRIAVKHILSHSTGLARHSYTNLTESGMDLLDIVPFFGNLRVYGKEGEYYGYQNAAFSMIEEVAAQKTGKEFTQLLHEKILDPAGMATATTSYEELMQIDNIALPHARNYRTKQFVPVTISDKYFNAVSAGGVNASAKDMGNWLKVLLGTRPDVVSPEILDDVFSPVVKTSHKRRYYDRWDGVEDSFYGIGWRILQYEDRQLIYHGGYVNFYASQIAIDRERGVGICVLFNAPNSYTSKVIPDFFNDYLLFDEVMRLGHVPNIITY